MATLPTNVLTPGGFKAFVSAVMPVDEAGNVISSGGGGGGGDASEATLASILAAVDGLETLSTALNALITTQAGYLDGLETALAGVLSVQRAQQQVQDLTITNATSLSPALDMGIYRLVGMTMPATLTTVSMTFQSSYDGTNYNDVYDASGTEKAISVGASRRVTLAPADFFGVRYIKIRSGTSGTPVVVGADRLFKMISER